MREFPSFGDAVRTLAIAIKGGHPVHVSGSDRIQVVSQCGLRH